MHADTDMRAQVLATMQRVYSNALTSTSGGNISAMDERGHIFITPSGIDKGALCIEDIVEVLPDGTTIGRHAPSMELPFHSNIYRTCPDVRAIVHAHAPAAVAYACMHADVPSDVTAFYADALGQVATSRYALPGSLKLGDIVMERFAAGYRSVMMDNHGATVGAANLEQAFIRYETLDYLCRTLFHATTLGQAHRLTEITERVPDMLPVKASQAGDKELRTQLCGFLHRAYRGQLVAGGFGTLAVRDGDGWLANPDEADRASVTPDQIVRFGKDSQSAVGNCRYRALIEQIFATNPQAQTVFVSYPAATMGFALAHEHFDARLIPESYIMLRDVSRLPYPADGDWSTVAKALTVQAPAAIVDNACVVTIGKNFTKAFDRMEVLDYSARSVLLAHGKGDIHPITQEQVDEINATFQGW